jgi:hypothetical protein
MFVGYFCRGLTRKIWLRLGAFMLSALGKELVRELAGETLKRVPLAVQI